jgi:glycosyltransferase involved in cell wall biosynthesis
MNCERRRIHFAPRAELEEEDLNYIFMKILLVITKAVVGGAQTSVLNLARYMKQRGHEVAVGAGDGDWLPAELAKENIAFVRFKNLRRTHNPLSGLFFIFEIRKFLKRTPPFSHSACAPRDGQGGVRGGSPISPPFQGGAGGGSPISPPFQGGAGGGYTAVHFNSSNALPGALGAKLSDKKIRTVFTFRGMSMLDEHYQINFFSRLFYRFFFKFFLLFIDAPVFVSRENLNKFGRGRLTAKGILVYNGLDPGKMDFFPRTEAREFFAEKVGTQNLAFLRDKYLIGSIGRLDYAKNYEFLIDIFPEVLKIKSDACAVIIGEGKERAKYEKLIAEKRLTDKIFLLGNIPDGGRYDKGFDLFAQTSRYEGLSIALLEALFAGLPIITTDVGGNREEVEAEEEIFQLDDRKEFLEKFKNILLPETRQKMILKNSQRAEKFLLKNTAAGYEKIYGER